MKKFYGLAALSALLSLASCSTDDPAVVNNGDAPAGVDDPHYIAVNISTDGGTRAVTDEFEYGKGDENKINSVTFLLFDINGNYIGRPNITLVAGDDDNDPVMGEPTIGDGDFDKKDTGTATGTEASLKSDKVVLVIDGQTTMRSSKILVVVNDGENNGLDLSDDNLKDEKATLTSIRQKLISSGNAAREINATTHEKSFLMVNSPYLSEGRIVDGALIQGHVHTSAADAKADPVNVYVERVAAKIRYIEPTDGMVISSTKIDVSHIKDTDVTTDTGISEVTFTPEVNGIYVYHNPSHSYLAKRIDENWGSDLFDNENHRTNWAQMPSTGITWNHYTWNEYAAETYTSKESKSFYVLENTQQDKKTGLLIAATLKDGSGNATTLVKYAGSYFTEDCYMERMAENINGKETLKKTDNSAFTAADFEWVSQATHSANTNCASYRSYLKLKDAVTKVSDATRTAINTELSGKLYHAQVWKDGKCYYFVDIENSALTGDAYKNFIYGVVRNNVYEVEILGIKGLGTPVGYPDEDIEPEKPSDSDTERYVAARIHVNSWRLVKQPVTFGE